MKERRGRESIKWRGRASQGIRKTDKQTRGKQKISNVDLTSDEYGSIFDVLQSSAFHLELVN